MVDTLVSGASASRRVGSTPIIRTANSSASAGLFFVYICQVMQKIAIFTKIGILITLL